MTRSIRLTAVTLLTTIGLSLGTAGVAEAGSKGRRNTAIGLGAVAIYGLTKKNKTIGALAGGGAIYSYVSSRKARSKERRRERRR